MLRDYLEKGITQLIDSPAQDAQLEQLLAYIALLQKWSEVINLTAVKTAKEMISRHVFDSLSILPDLEGERILDVGSGAGLPGIPLAIMQPDKRFFLLEARQKRVHFLKQVVSDLALTNVEIVHCRVEAYAPEVLFDAIVARAFAPLPRFVAMTNHLLKGGGCWLAMLGQAEAVEHFLPDSGHAIALRALQVPDQDKARHIAVIRK